MGHGWVKGAALAAPVAVLLAVLAGCATPAPSTSAGSDPTPSDAADEVLLCQGEPVSAKALQEARPATELAPEVVAVLEDPLAEGPLSDWLIATESADHVVIMRRIEPPDELPWGDIREYEIVAISAAAEHAMPLTPPWGVDMSSSCTPTIDLGELSEAGITLDPDALPEDDDDVVALLVTEFACNSGGPATGRIELVELVESDTTIEVVIGVRRHDDGMARTCPSNSPTPFTVELEQPLGDRTILNATVVPAREITVPQEPREITVPDRPREITVPDGR